MRPIVVLLLVALAGCQPASKTGTEEAAGAPKLIAELTDQTLIYECPVCHMDFEGPGECTMCDVALVKTEVAYICPADENPVERAGKCPRCDQSARIVKTALATDAPETPGGE